MAIHTLTPMDNGAVSIHNEHPFLAAEGDRNPVRRLRGRLASPVSVLTAGQDRRRAGLTVSSVLVVDGEPGTVLAVIDPLSELHDAVLATGSAVLNLLGWQHHQLADAFGYQAPAPGGPFRLGDWTDTRWGPALDDAPAWAGCRLTGQPTPIGWGVQLRLDIEQVQIGPDGQPLVHHRGRYHRL
jgi:flavin reductase (DIM6/NTAB) family NADH-FMN oxidoreductase RutF